MTSNAFGFVVDQKPVATATNGANFGNGNSINLLFSTLGGGTADGTGTNNNDFSSAGPGSADTVSSVVNLPIAAQNSKPAENPFDHMLDDFGLSMTSIQANNGQQAADRLPRILNKLTPSTSHQNDELSAAQKVMLSKSLLQWHSLAYRDVRSKAIYQNTQLLLHCFTLIFFLPDDLQHGDYMVQGHQVPAFNISRLLQQEAQESPEFRVAIFPELITTINTMLEHYSSISGSSRTLSDAVRSQRSGDYGSGCSTSLREEGLRALLNCFPPKVNDLQQLKFSIAVLLRLLIQGNGAQVLCAEASRRLQSIGVDHEDDLSLYMALWGDRTSDLLAAIKCGNTELKRILKKNKALFVVQRSNLQLEAHLSELVDSLGFEDICDFLQEIADADASQLIPAIPNLLRQLTEASYINTKLQVMGLLLAIALSHRDGCEALLPHLGGIGSVCTIMQPLFIPFFKLLTVISSLGDEASVQCLFMVASTAKSGLVQSDTDKAAVLESVNIIKDKFSYSNIFKADTLKVLEDFSHVNRPIFDNILRWNSGKSARKGDRKDYLMNAGRINQRRPGKLGSIFGRSPSGRKANYSATGGMTSGIMGSSLKMGTSVSPSPQSQNYSYIQSSYTSSSGLPPNSPWNGFMNNSVVPVNSPPKSEPNHLHMGAMVARPPPSPTITTAGTTPLSPSIISASAGNYNSQQQNTREVSPRRIPAANLFPSTDSKNRTASSIENDQYHQHELRLPDPTDSRRAGRSQSPTPGKRISLRNLSPFGRKAQPTQPSRPDGATRSSSNSSSMNRNRSKRELRLEESASQKKRDEQLAQELQQLRMQVSQLEGNLK